jgi:class 3 adenylate cyclase
LFRGLAAKRALARPWGEVYAAVTVARLDIPSRVYRRLGDRYLRAALVPGFQGGHLVAVTGLVTMALYLDLSATEFLVLFAATELVFWIPESLVALRFARRRLEPVERWLAGERDARTCVEAWRAAVTLPGELLRYRPFWLFLFVAAPAWDVFAVVYLGLPGYVIPLLIVGNCLVYLYWELLRFLSTERWLRPVLRELGAAPPDDAAGPGLTISLRTRLLASLPALALITGAVAPGASSGVTDQAARLGLGLGAAFVVTLIVGIPLIELLAYSVATPIAELEEATRRVAGGDLEVRVPVTSTDESGRLARSFNEMVAGLAERERLRETFGAYVDPEIAEHILREGTDLGGEEVEVTMMFLDVRDFTGYAERAEAQDVVAALNRLWECVVPVIHEHGGHVDKFVGDGLLAVFGAPRRQADHADEAVAAALEIDEHVKRDLDGELEIGIGINSGSVVAGNVGGAGRLEFSVIGDAVNVAARVEAATRETGDPILVTGATRDLMQDPDRVGLEERDAVPLKGKTESVELFAVRATSAASAARRPA